MADNEDFKPRDYQLQLMQIALKQNTIIYLPTGTGKTFIAIMTLKQMSASLLRSVEGEGKITAFLVNTVALVDQHTQYLRRHTPFKVGAYTGSMNVDFWDEKIWKEEINKHQVLIMTSQIFLNIVTSCFLDLNKVNLVIFDECHRGVNDHAMRQIMIGFKGLEEQPRVIGLTATLLNGNCKANQVLKEVYDLETTYHSKVATIDELRYVIGYATNPKEHVRTFASHQLSHVELEIQVRLNKLIDILSDLGKSGAPPLNKNLKRLVEPNSLQPLINMIQDARYHIELFGIFGGSVTVIAYLIQLERIKKNCQEKTSALVVDVVISTFNVIKCGLHEAMKSYSDEEKLYQFSSPKVLKLIDVLEEYLKESKEPLCGIIFVRRRFTAKILSHVLLALKSAKDIFKGINSSFVVGFNCNPYNSTREDLYNTKMNKKVIQQFCKKEVNLIVASNVLEEGIDIPNCTFICMFDAPLDYRAYMQSKGRARHKNSFYYIMVEESIVQNYRGRYQSFQEVENILHTFLIGHNESREGPTETDLEELYNDHDLPPYYVDGPGSPQVNMVTAVPLLCRYCQSLPADKYTSYAPDWYIEKQDSQCRIVVELPIICPVVGPFTGSFMKTKKNAKRAVALKVCEMLHKCGELDNNLLPKKYIEEDTSFLFKHWPVIKETFVGNMKSRRAHAIQVPSICRGQIKCGTVSYLHVIQLIPSFPSSDECYGQKLMHKLISSSLCFGIITSQQLRPICKFPVYISLGEIQVQLIVNSKLVVLSEETFRNIRVFHHLLFNDILKIVKPFLIFNNDPNAEMMLVVPVSYNGDYNIATDVLTKYKTVADQKLEPPEKEKFCLEVNEERYLEKIVTPWYRNDDRQYIVTSVCSDLNALSEFPSQEFNTYSDYYKEKYHVRVLNPMQPLLLVKGLSKQLNCLKPRGCSSSSKKRPRDKIYEDVNEHLLAELCVRQEFPATLWIQAHLLPSILHRINCFLRAEELRRTIAIQTNLGMYEVKRGEAWAPLLLDKSLPNFEEKSKPKESPDSKKNILCNDETMDTTSLMQPIYSVIEQLDSELVDQLLNEQYPWSEQEEPIDIERNFNVTIMDIHYYENFLCKVVAIPERTKNDVVLGNPQIRAISYDKKYVFKGIKLLENLTLDKGPELSEIYKALCPAKCNEIVNLERLETLGDSFLKVSVSLYIILKYPQYNEGSATALKGKMVSNKNLFYVALNKNLGGYLIASEFSPSFEWLPPGYCIPQCLTDIRDNQLPMSSLFNVNISLEEQLSGILTRDTIDKLHQHVEKTLEDGNVKPTCGSLYSLVGLQEITDKTVADNVEALLGAYFQALGFNSTLRLLEWLNIIPKSENISDILNGPPPNPVLNEKCTQDNIDYHIPSWSLLEERLGYHFKNRAYLLQALTHSTYTPNRITNCYQRLEFLGDAVLDFLITCHIFEKCENLTPGQLTDLRSALVNNNTFASFSVRCGFHKFLLFSNIVLHEHINNFVKYQEAKDFEIDEHVLILLEEEDMHLAEHVDVPKVLGDVFEALAGAIYLDCGMDLKTVWSVFYPIMWKEIESFSNNVPKNPVRVLYETVGAHPMFRRPMEVENKTMVTLDFMLNGDKKSVHGFGDNKGLAKRAAAKIALRLLQGTSIMN